MALPPAMARPLGALREEVINGVVVGAVAILGDELNSRVKQIYNTFEKTLKGWGDLAVTAIVGAVMYVLAPRIPVISAYAGRFLEAIIVKLIVELDEKYSMGASAFMYIDEGASKLVVEGADGEGILCIDSGKATGGAGDNGCKHVTLSGGKAEVPVSLSSGNSIVMFMANDGKYYVKLVPWKVVFA